MKNETELRNHYKYTDDVLDSLLDIEGKYFVSASDIQKAATVKSKAIASDDVFRRIKHRLKRDGFIEYENDNEDKIRLTHEGAGHHWYGGYIEQHNMGSLAERLADSNLRTNRLQRRSIRITVTVSVVTALALLAQLLLQSRQIKIEERNSKKELMPTLNHQDSHDIYYMNPKNDSLNRKKKIE